MLRRAWGVLIWPFEYIVWLLAGLAIVCALSSCYRRAVYVAPVYVPPPAVYVHPVYHPPIVAVPAYRPAVIVRPAVVVRPAYSPVYRPAVYVRPYAPVYRPSYAPSYRASYSSVRYSRR